MFNIAIVFACFIFFLQSDFTYGGKYPQQSLQCYSYMTKPDLKLICPEARSSYCVKDVTSLTQNLCGATQYYGDLYINKQCQFKKCSDECVEGTTTFTFQGQVYTRDRYCCTTNYCNAASKPHQVCFYVIAFAALLLIYLI